MAALFKSVKLGSAGRLLQLTGPAAATTGSQHQQQRNLNLLEYQAKGLLQVNT
jgi:hypothetical protein